MTTNTHNGRWSHRLGRGAGRAWRGYLRREVAAGHWQLLAEPLQLAAWVREFVVQQEARHQPSEQSAA